MERSNISPAQGAMLLITTITSTAIILLPGAIAGRDAWLATLGGLLLGLVTALLITALGRRFPRQTPVEYAEAILGKYLGRVVSLMLLAYFVYLAALTLWDLGVFIGSTLLVGTPVVFINAIGILVSLYAARQGLEVIARVNQVFLPLILISVMASLLAVSFMAGTDFARIFPLLETGIRPVVAGSITAADWLGESVVLAMIIPFLVSPKAVRPVVFGGVLLSGVLLALIALVVVATFDAAGPAFFFPFYNAVLMIEIAKVIRLDLMIVTIWVVGVFIKLSILLYIISFGTAQWFESNNHNPLVLPLSAVILGLSIIIVANAAEYEYLSLSISMYLFFKQLLLPAFLLMAAVLTGKAAVRKE